MYRRFKRRVERSLRKQGYDFHWAQVIRSGDGYIVRLWHKHSERIFALRSNWVRLRYEIGEMSGGKFVRQDPQYVERLFNSSLAA